MPTRDRMGECLLRCPNRATSSELPPSVWHVQLQASLWEVVIVGSRCALLQITNNLHVSFKLKATQAGLSSVSHSSPRAISEHCCGEGGFVNWGLGEISLVCTFYTMFISRCVVCACGKHQICICRIRKFYIYLLTPPRDLNAVGWWSAGLARLVWL